MRQPGSRLGGGRRNGWSEAVRILRALRRDYPDESQYTLRLARALRDTSYVMDRANPGDGTSVREEGVRLLEQEIEAADDGSQREQAAQRLLNTMNQQPGRNEPSARR